jgi:hypothetical protein
MYAGRSVNNADTNSNMLGRDTSIPYRNFDQISVDSNPPGYEPPPSYVESIGEKY